jgi:hypothetical protein
MSEGFNSRIQTIKNNARDFRAFDKFRTLVLFCCGKLNLFSSEVYPLSFLKNRIR